MLVTSHLGARCGVGNSRRIISSTLLTLFLLPALYRIFEREIEAADPMPDEVA